MPENTSSVSNDDSRQMCSATVDQDGREWCLDLVWG